MNQMHCLSDVGKVRTHNEDAAQIFSNDFVTVMAVADGMGGHACGDIASQIAIEKVKAKFNADTQFLVQDAARRWLKEVLQEINGEIISYIEENKVEKGMGTTMVIAILAPTFISFGHVGDSRAYLMTASGLRQITKDHTFVGKLIEEGKLSKKKAKSHPHRNVIMNALGVSSTLKFDYLLLENFDLKGVLLCTDGLTSMVEDPDIEEVLEKDLPVEEKVGRLIDLANEKGGRDNVTAALYEFGKGSVQK
ncbi:MAG: Stp1/IreP family PP2C-type Ser/Thr phosphatase [Turicibacter sp.]|nr:Stp1/IreP family PP2C-type Ser/Thr phosphatase [Turicibacter sp.]